MALDHTQMVETERKLIIDTVQNQIKKLVLGEVPQALEALILTLLDKIIETIDQAISSELNKRKAGTLIENRAENAIELRNLDMKESSNTKTQGRARVTLAEADRTEMAEANQTGPQILLLYQTIDMPYSIDLNTLYQSTEWIQFIMEYLVKISKKARIMELKRRNMKKLILTSYMSYPSRKIRRIRDSLGSRIAGLEPEQEFNHSGSFSRHYFLDEKDRP
ncbi:hypothetical protein Tco_0352092 [Tanacetum coccineum]